MLEQRRYTDNEYNSMWIRSESFAESIYILNHKEYFGRNVEVIKGRKVPIGTTGKVVRLYLNEYLTKYNTKYHFIKVGIKTEDDEILYTNIDNIKIIRES